mmetsp:Transcript_27403/g.64909  ORF Transcript_27403/g.64909 Transcript_27403/m.64909 type:complete len:209 (-) Transcript_27403:128-754(-)
MGWSSAAAEPMPWSLPPSPPKTPRRHRALENGPAAPCGARHKHEGDRWRSRRRGSSPAPALIWCLRCCSRDGSFLPRNAGGKDPPSLQDFWTACASPPSASRLLSRAGPDIGTRLPSLSGEAARPRRSRWQDGKAVDRGRGSRISHPCLAASNCHGTLTAMLACALSLWGVCCAAAGAEATAIPRESCRSACIAAQSHSRRRITEVLG